jgi:hypothetical protein
MLTVTSVLFHCYWNLHRLVTDKAKLYNEHCCCAYSAYLPSISVVVFSLLPLISTLANGNVSLLESLSVITRNSLYFVKEIVVIKKR